MDMLRYIVFITELFAKFEYKEKFLNKIKINVKIRKFLGKLVKSIFLAYFLMLRFSVLEALFIMLCDF